MTQSYSFYSFVLEINQSSKTKQQHRPIGLRAKKVLHYVKQGIFREVATDTNTKRIKKTGHAHEADQA